MQTSQASSSHTQWQYSTIGSSSSCFEWSTTVLQHYSVVVLKQCMPLTSCDTKTRERKWLLSNGSRLDLKPARRVAREILLKINRSLPGHVVFAGMLRKGCSIISDHKKWPSMTYISVKIRSKLKDLEKRLFLSTPSWIINELEFFREI